MFAFYTSLSKRTKYSKLCVFLTDLESDTQWGRDHRNLTEAFVYCEFDMFSIGYPYYDQLTPVKTRYPLTSIT